MSLISVLPDNAHLSSHAHSQHMVFLPVCRPVKMMKWLFVTASRMITQGLASMMGKISAVVPLLPVQPMQLTVSSI